MKGGKPPNRKMPFPVGDFFAPQPMANLAFLRIFLALAILGFLSFRIPHAGEWLSVEGFSVPLMPSGDWRQPLYLPPLPLWQAWLLCGMTVASGLLISLGFHARLSAVCFAACLVYLALADRLAAFTVSKLGAVLMVALVFTPCGEAYSLQAVGRRFRPYLLCTWGNIRFFQILLVTFYCLSGIAKLRGDWLDTPHILFTHLHDSYQTRVSYLFGRYAPMELWQGLRWMVLGFETLAPLWFALPWTRLPALLVGLGMHAFIGLAFGPVIWFSLFMMIFLLGCFAPASWLDGLIRTVHGFLARIFRRLRPPPSAYSRPRSPCG